MLIFEAGLIKETVEKLKSKGVVVVSVCTDNASAIVAGVESLQVRKAFVSMLWPARFT